MTPKFDVDRNLYPFESKYIDAGDTRIHYIDEGDGPTLLLLHGNPSWSFLYRKMIPRLRDRYRCVAPDYPGFGLTVAPPDYRYTPREHSRALEAFVDALKLEGAIAMVQDWGGPVGLGLAGRRPELFRGFVIGNTFAWPLTDFRVKVFSTTMGGPPGRLAAYAFNGVVKFFMKEGVRTGLTKDELAMYLAPFAERSSRKATFISPWLLTRSEVYLNEVQQGLTQLRDRPALIAWGTADFAFREAERKRFESAFPDHHVTLLPGSGHFVQEDAPEAICDALLEWDSIRGTG